MICYHANRPNLTLAERMIFDLPRNALYCLCIFKYSSSFNSKINQTLVPNGVPPHCTFIWLLFGWDMQQRYIAITTDPTNLLKLLLFIGFHWQHDSQRLAAHVVEHVKHERRLIGQHANARCNAVHVIVSYRLQTTNTVGHQARLPADGFLWTICQGVKTGENADECTCAVYRK